MNRIHQGQSAQTRADLPTTDPRLYFAAINGLAHSLHLLTAPGDLTQAQLQRAVGKATRAATAIKRMASETWEG